MYKGVQAGTVDSIDISEDLELAVVHATMAKQVKHHLNEGTQFWVVRPEVSLTGITGLSTLVSGPYIAIQPGDGKRQRAFKGLSQPPLDLETGTRFGLKADKLGTLHVSAPIHHHGLKVGKILEFDLAKDDSGLDIQILIYQPYDQLVRTNSLFWNTSGIDLNLRNLFDASLRVGSFESLVAGGIAFANPAGPAEAAPAETVFELHAIRPGAVDMNDVEEATEFKVILTAEALGGVEEGNAVLYREIQIGTVRKTQLNAAADGVEIHLGIAPAHSGLVRTDSVFWNASGVKLNLGDLVDASVEIESLKSLLAGGVALANPSDPGPQAESGTTYKLQAKRPEALFRQKTASDGLHIVLRSEVQGSVKLDDPILYREVEVGKVMEVELSDDASFVALKVAIEPRYAPLVRSHSVFWNASGIHASFGLFSGADIDIESLSALLRGGIAFATPREGGKAVANAQTSGRARRNGGERQRGGTAGRSRSDPIRGNADCRAGSGHDLGRDRAAADGGGRVGRARQHRCAQPSACQAGLHQHRQPTARRRHRARGCGLVWRAGQAPHRHPNRADRADRIRRGPLNGHRARIGPSKPPPLSTATRLKTRSARPGRR
jgi:paraquat-inducible protein B